MFGVSSHGIGAIEASLDIPKSKCYLLELTGLDPWTNIKKVSAKLMAIPYGKKFALGKIISKR